MASRNPDRKVTINKFPVIKLALQGRPDQIESLFTVTTRTMARLGLTTRGVRRTFKKTPRGGVGEFSLSGTKKWLNDILNTPQYAEDIAFLKKLHYTLEVKLQG